MTLEAQWQANTDTTFTVNIHMMGTDGEYDVVETPMTGTTDSKIVFTSNETTLTINGTSYTYPGMKFNSEKSTVITTEIYISGNGDTEFDVYFDRMQFTLTLNKGTGIGSVSMTPDPVEGKYYYGQEVTINAVVSEGYTWSTWTVADGIAPTTKDQTGFVGTTQNQTIIIGLGDVTLQAEATINSYKLFIDPNGGNYAGIDDVDETSGLQYVKMPYMSTYTLNTPSKDGFDFAGWALKEGSKGNVQYVAETGWVYTFGAGDGTVIAQWSANRYEVVINLNDFYNDNGTTTAETTLTTLPSGTELSIVDGKITLYATYGQKYDKLYVSTSSDEYVSIADFTADTLTRDGYTFVNFTDSEGNPVTANTICDETSSVEIKANWQAEVYDLTVNVNKAGKVSVAVTGAAEEEGVYKVTFDTEITLTATPSEGYHFVNYTATSELSQNATYKFRYTNVGPMTITANVANNTYTITYNNNGGSGTIDPTDATYDENVTLSSGEGFVKAGYTLTGWAYEEETYEPSEEGIFNFTSVNGGSVELRAIWTANTYNVNFVTNGGTDMNPMNGVTYDVPTMITESTTKAGYNFLGYALTNGTSAEVTTVTDEDIQGASCADLTEYLVQLGEGGIYLYNENYYVFNLAETNGATVPVYAIWTPGKADYKVEYYLEGLTNNDWILDTDFKEEGITFTPNSTTINGNTESLVTIDETKTYTGFTLDKSVAGTKTSGEVAGDGSLTLRLYYRRNTYSVNIIIPDLSDAERGETGITGVNSVDTTGTYKVENRFKFNTEVTVSADIKAGYTFNNYTVTDGEVYTTGASYTFTIKNDTEITIKLTRGTFNYTINYKFQNLEGTAYVDDENYESTTLSGLVDSKVLYSDIAGKIVEVPGFLYAGFTENVTVTSDGLAEVNINYDRDFFEITLQTTTGVASLTATGDYCTPSGTTEGTTTYRVKFDSSVTLNYVLNAGYAFKSWSETLVQVGTDDDDNDLTGFGTLTMPADDLNIVVNTTPVIVDFTLNYLGEAFKDYDPESGNFDVFTVSLGTETKQGYTDTEIDDIRDYNPKDFDGFTRATFESGKKISGDGKTVINVYYTRNDINITVDLTEGVESITLNVNETDYILTKEFTADESISIKYGAKVYVSYTLTDDAGYKFVSFNGVQVDADGSGNYFTVPKDAFTLSITTEPNEFTITFQGNNGTYTPSEPEQDNTYYTQTGVKFNREVTLMANEFTRAGYEFLGWATSQENANSRTVEYADGESFMFDNAENMTLYAVWGNNTYTITYNGNGGYIEQEEGDPIVTYPHGEEVNYDEKITLLENRFDRTGFTFVGWSRSDKTLDTTGLTNSDGTWTAINLTTKANENVVLYAWWEENTYTLKYNSNYSQYSDNEDVEIEDKVYTYTEKFNALAHSDEKLNFALTGYTFAGWNRKPDGTGDSVNAGEELESLTAKDNDTVVLYAIWEANKYTIVFDGNGATSGNMDSVTATYDTPYAIAANGFNKTAYDFNGWSLSNDNVSVVKNVDSLGEITTSGIYYLTTTGTYYVYNLATGETDDTSKTIYVAWLAHTYTITYMANGGTFDESLTAENTYEKTFTIEDTVTFVSGDELTLEGHTLVGYSLSNINGNWTDKFSGDITLSATPSVTGVYGNITLTAIWRINSYNLTITYKYGTNGNDKDGTEAYDEFTSQVEFNASYNQPSPSINGYTADQLTVSGTMPAHDVEVEVLYTANVYTLTFNYMDTTGTGDVDKFEYDKVKVKYDAKYETAYVEGQEGKPVGLGAPTREGYTFAGWYTDSKYSAGTLITDDDVVSILRDTEIFARWTPNADTAYKVEYYFESLDSADNFEIDASYTKTGTGTTDTAITETMVKTLTSGQWPTKTGFTYSRNSLNNTTINADGSTVVKVYYSRDYNTLTLNSTDGIDSFVASANKVAEGQQDTFYITGSGNTYRVRYGSEIKLTYTISDNGYRFVNYTATGIDAEQDIDDNGVFTMIDSNIQITANAAAKEFTIIFHKNDGVEPEETTTQTATYRETVKLNNNTFERAGYGFAGWARSPESTEVAYANGADFTLSSNYATEYNLYAIWTADAISFTIDAGTGIIKENIVLKVNGEVKDVNTATLRYEDNVEIDVSGAIKNGYDFESIVNGATTIREMTYSFVLTETTVLKVNATPRNDSQFKVVFAQRNIEDTAYVETESQIVSGATTDKVVTRVYLDEFISNIDTKFAGFFYTSFSNSLTEGEQVFTIIYNQEITEEDEEGSYTTVYILYNRYHYGMSLNATTGYSTFTADGTVDGTVNYYDADGEYRVDFGAEVRIYLDLNPGYSLEGFSIKAIEATGSKDGTEETVLGEEHDLTFKEDENAYYLNDTKLFTFIYNDAGYYVLSVMPYYDLEITANITANEYEVRYYRYWNTADVTYDPDTVTFNNPYSIKNINKFPDFNKSGWDFAGWATSKVDADQKTVTYRAEDFVDGNDLSIGNYTFDYDLELYAVWTQGNSAYKIEYYLEELNGDYNIDSERTKNLSGLTDSTVTTTDYEVSITGYVINRELSTTSGIVTADGQLTLKLYYERINYKLTINGNNRFTSLGLVASENVTNKNFNEETCVYTADVTYGATVTLTYVTVPGYTFASWNVTSGSADIEGNTLTMPADNVVVSVVEKPETYTLTFEANGGHVEGEEETTSYEQQFEYMSSANLTANKFVKDGYTFKNWTINGKTYQDNELFTYNFTENVTATAEWTPNTNTAYKIIVHIQNLNGEGYTSSTAADMTGTTDATITQDNAKTALINKLTELGITITRGEEGFNFVRFEEDDLTINGNGTTVVNAYFDRKILTNEFRIDSEGVEKIVVNYFSIEDKQEHTFEYTTGAENKTIRVAFGQEFTIQPIFEAGYEFDLIARYFGEDVDFTWNHEDLGAGQDTNTLTTSSGINDNAIYAVTAKRLSYTITYHENFLETGTGTDTQTVTYLDAFSLRTPFSHAGYNFLGWAEEEDGAKVYEPTQSFNNYTWTNNIDLYGVWEAITYTIKYNPYQASEGEMMEDTAVTYDVITALSNNVFTYLGHNFVGWSLSAGGENVVQTVATKAEIVNPGYYYCEEDSTYYVYNVTVTDKDVITLSPVWEANTYKVILHSNTEADLTSDIGDFEYGVEGKIPAFNTLSWTNEGYDFNGWYYMNGDDKVLLGEGVGADKEVTFMNLTLNDNATVDLYVNWVKGLTTYKAIILKQMLNEEYDSTDPENYILFSSSLSAITGDFVTAKYVYDTYIVESEYAEITGFTYDAERNAEESFEIKGDGSTTVYIYYTRNTYTLNITLGTGIESAEAIIADTNYSFAGQDGNVMKYNIYYQGQVSMTATAKQGYQDVPPTFVSNTSDVEIEEGNLITMPAKDVFVTVSAEPDKDTVYGIEVYLADATGDYEDTTTLKTTGTGTTDEAIDLSTAQGIANSTFADELVGYTYTRYEFANSVSTIAGDGSSIIKLYYQRVPYRVTFSSSLTNGAQIPEQQSVIHGTEVEVVFVINQGYNLPTENRFKVTSGESDYSLELQVEESETPEGLKQYTVTFTMPTSNINININVAANTDTKYTVIYKFESVKNLNTYDEALNETHDFTGTTGEVITKDMIGLGEEFVAPTGFTLSHTNIDDLALTIGGDGKTVVEVFFLRLRQNLKVELHDDNQGIDGDVVVKVEGVVVPTMQTREWTIAYEQKVELTFNMKSGYTFDGFVVSGNVKDKTEDVSNRKLTFTTDVEDVNVSITLTARNSKYTVRYFLQKVVDIDNYYDQDPANYDVLNWAVEQTAPTNTHLTTENITTQFITNIESLSGYNSVKDKFIGYDLTDDVFTTGGGWISATVNSTDDITDWIYVDGNGTTVINLYINRLIVNVDINVDDDTHIGNVDGENDYVYGDVVTMTANTNPGYIFDYLMFNDTRLDKDSPNLKVVDNDDNTQTVTYTFTITEDTIAENGGIDIQVYSTFGTAKYTIELYKQVLDNSLNIVFGEPEKIELTGTTESAINYEEYTTAPAGYTYEVERTVADETIKGDGTSIVKLYFMLNAITFHLTYGEGVTNVQVYSTFGSVAQSEVVDNVYTYTVSYTDTIYFEVELEVGYDFNGIGLLVDGKYEIQDNSANPEYRMVIPAEEFNIQAIASRRFVYVYYFTDTSSSSYADFSMHQYGDTVTLKPNTFTKDGATFMGWATTTDKANQGVVDYEDGATFTITGNVNLYAVWAESGGSNWWIWIIIAFAIILVIVIIIIIIVVVKKKKEKDKIRAK